MNGAEMIRARIVGGAFDTAAEEMSATVTRTARSPIFNEAHDFTTGIFDLKDGRARLIAQAPGCTLHLYAICSAVQAALDVFRNDLHPGDVILASDPYHGGTHIPDHVVILPVFADRKPVFFPVVRAHFADSGGPVAGGYNPASRDIWQDGVIVPPIKIYERGEKRRDVFDMILANNRVRDWLIGDLDAMRGACLTAAKGIERVIGRSGWPRPARRSRTTSPMPNAACGRKSRAGRMGIMRPRPSSTTIIRARMTFASPARRGCADRT